ncbi:3-keto-disaccharide hydrolase [Alteromonas antoniana]|uniref:3-keto-disaccharide hydrolase n=1 Tax=Alteromonas antoniana TaxID=2803813 RepID=UPI001C4789E4|nr:DUF1080 domain-containing protein [Alteromonas antoniana]
MKMHSIGLITLTAGIGALSACAMATDDDRLTREQQAAKTEVWKPVPPVVEAKAGDVPSDAVVLFDGTDLSAWESVNGGDAQWTVGNGTMTVKPGTGDIKTKESFCDIQLHFEWKTPTDVAGLEGQQRNNSGIFLQQRYEIQVLDSYNNKTYPNGQAGSVYKQTIPLVNAMREPGEWQEYDIIFNAPEFDGEELVKPGYVTVLHNGVLVQNHTEILGKTEWIGPASYEAHGCAPLQLQDHSNPVSFRNIWVREIGDNHVTRFD